MKRFARLALGACVCLIVVGVTRRLFPHMNFQVAATVAFLAIIIGVPLYKSLHGTPPR